jgi:Tol biopolymer transport system component
MKQIKKYLLIAITPFLVVLFSSCKDSQVSSDSTPVDEYVHMRAAWSPDGSTIAFTSLAQNAAGIFLIDSSGGNLRSILSGDGLGITWSPDGRWLAFARNSYLHKMKPNGDSLTQLGELYGAIRPAWSLDGSKLAFVQRDAETGIWLCDLMTTKISQLISYGNYPSWHPITGEVIVLDTRVDLATGLAIYSFVAVSPATLAARTISSFATLSDCGFPRVSPDGNSIVYSLRRPDDYCQILIFDITRVQHRRLTDDGGDVAAWSPDGKKIVYTRTQQGDGGLWVMNADGSNKRRLTKP